MVKCRILRRRVYVFEIVRAGGIMMLPIILCSIVAIAIVIERFWTLSPSRIAPRNALADVWAKIKHNQLDAAQLRAQAQAFRATTVEHGMYLRFIKRNEMARSDAGRAGVRVIGQVRRQS